MGFIDIILVLQCAKAGLKFLIFSLEIQEPYVFLSRMRVYGSISHSTIIFLQPKFFKLTMSILNPYELLDEKPEVFHFFLSEFTWNAFAPLPPRTCWRSTWTTWEQHSLFPHYAESRWSLGQLIWFFPYWICIYLFISFPPRTCWRSTWTTWEQH